MGMEKKHLVAISNPGNMHELPDAPVQLIATSPPLFEINRSFGDFSRYLQDMQLVFSECHRVLEDGACICLNACENINNRYSNPSPAHFALLLRRAGFVYRDDIIWRRPAHPPHSGMAGQVIIMRKGAFDRKTTTGTEKRQAAMDIQGAMQYWAPDSQLLYPGGLFEPLIRIFTHEGETVLDPFLGNGRTAADTATIGRRLIGYCPNRSRLPSILQGSGIAPHNLRIINRRLI